MSIPKNPWRERVGIEPTSDNPCRTLGFEDREGHQCPIRPHVRRSSSGLSQSVR